MPIRSAITLLACAAFALACHEAAAPTELRLAVSSGDQQHAPAGGRLPGLIVVQLRDASRGPIAGATVEWRQAAGSADLVWAIGAYGPTTDSQGFAKAVWQLDSTPGPHVLTASVAGAPSVSISAFADSDSVLVPTVHVLSLSSYDGSGQLVHPDLARVPDAWGDGPYRLAATPFPNGQATLENPSLFAGATLTTFDVPAGVVNPLVRPDSGYLSDPDMVFDPDANVLSMYYRKVALDNQVWLIKTSDGVNWSTPKLVVEAPSQMVVSPTIVRRGVGNWLMWSVNAGVAGCIGPSTTIELRTSTDGVAWSAPRTVTLTDAAGFAWHIDVEWIASRNEYWALYPIKEPGSCTTGSLRLATSGDGVQWKTYPSPVLARGAIPEFHDIVYRASMEHDTGSIAVTVYYSGARAMSTLFAWGMAYEELTDSALFARVNAPAAAEVGSHAAPAAVAHPLTDATAP